MATTTKKVPVQAPSKQANPAGVVKSAIAPEESIRFRAYEIFRLRTAKGQFGDAMSDWLQAEREIAGRTLTAAKTPELRA